MDASEKHASLMRRLAELDLPAAAEVVRRHRYQAPTLAQSFNGNEALEPETVCFGCGESMRGIGRLCSLVDAMYVHYVELPDEERRRAEADAAEVFARLRALDTARPRSPHDLREWFLRYARAWADVPAAPRVAR